MGKIAFCFPGQLQERPILEDHHPLREDLHFKELMERASHQTSFDLLSFSFRDCVTMSLRGSKTTEAISQGTENKEIATLPLVARNDEKGVKTQSLNGGEAGFNLKLQISTYLLSMVHFYCLRAKGWTPDILAEHSMGVYSALAASEAISFEEGLFVTESIGRLLEIEGTSSPGAMASIIGLSLEEIQKICHQLDGYHLFIANYNGSMHYVLSGEEEGVEKAISFALSRKAISATRLSFQTPLHSSPLFSLREKIVDLLKDIKIQSPQFPILNHWTIKPLKREEIKDFLSQEIARPVYWIRCVEKMIQEGVTQFIEVGHESTLTKLIRWINREVGAFSTGDRLQEGI